MNFNYADFKAFSGSTDINEHAYVVIAQGVLDYIKNQYGIFPEVESAQTLNIWLDKNQKVFNIPAEPITTLISITYDGTLLDPTTDYSYYGRDVVLTTALTDPRIPLEVTADLGYVDVPLDLKLAVYRHIEAAHFSIKQHTDSISQASNSTGNTTSYRDNEVPRPSLNTYRYYAGQPQALF